jgi:hypothetical protein
MLVKMRRSLLVQCLCNVIKSKLCIFLAIINMPSFMYIVKAMVIRVANTNSQYSSHMNKHKTLNFYVFFILCVVILFCSVNQQNAHFSIIF